REHENTALVIHLALPGRATAGTTPTQGKRRVGAADGNAATDRQATDPTVTTDTLNNNGRRPATEDGQVAPVIHVKAATGGACTRATTDRHRPGATRQGNGTGHAGATGATKTRHALGNDGAGAVAPNDNV